MPDAKTTDTETIAPDPTATDIETMTLTLSKPIDLTGQTYAHLDLCEPTAAEMMRWANLEGPAAQIKAVATVSKVPETVIRQIGASELNKAASFIESFGILPVREQGDAPPPATMTVHLRKSIKSGKDEILELELREPMAGELIAWDKADGIDADCTIIAAVSGLPIVAIRQLGARDLVEAGAYLANFMMPGR